MQKTRDSRTFLAWLLAALAALALLLGYSHLYGDSWLSSDDSSEMILSRILAGEGGILTENWHYSTELRVLNTQLVWSAPRCGVAAALPLARSFGRRRGIW
ncbi:MAG: hypothetical protein SPE74_04335 [Oscillospiraceae bacterium]|nr:hypothetical protein [Oscillospiraceae bacterium]